MNPMEDTAPHQGIHELQVWAKWLGRIFTVIAAVMTFWFGYQYSFVIGVGLAATTVLVAIILNFVSVAWKAGERVTATALACFWLFAGTVEVCSHLGYTVFHRAEDVTQAQLQDTRFDDTQSQKQELAEKKKLLEGRLAKLEGAAGWVSTKPSAAWKAEIANLEGDKLFARSRQCTNVTKSDSRAFCDKLTELRANLAVAEDHDSTVAQLKATETALANTREKSAEMHRGGSAVLSQQKMFASFATASLTPGAEAVAWAGFGIGGVMALLFSFAATVCNFVGFKEWGASLKEKAERAAEANPLQPQIDELKAMIERMALASQRTAIAPVAPVPAPASHTHEKEVVVLKEDDPRAKAAYGVLETLAKEARVLRAA